MLSSACQPWLPDKAVQPADEHCSYTTPWGTISSVPLPGSIAAAGSPRIGRTSIARRLHFCVSPQSASCYESFAIQLDVSGQTLSIYEFAEVEDPRTRRRCVRMWLSEATIRKRRRNASSCSPWGRDRLVVVAVGDRSAHHQQQNLGQRMGHRHDACGTSTHEGWSNSAFKRDFSPNPASAKLITISESVHPTKSEIAQAANRR